MKQRFASAFRSLAEWLSPAPRPDSPQPIHDLTDDDIALLRAFRATEEYDLFIEVLDKEQKLVGEAMLGCSDTIRLHECRGHVLGIRNAASIIDRILVAEAERKKTDERRRSNAEHGNDHRLATGFASPYWDAVRRRS